MPRLRDIVGDGLDALINNAAVSPKRSDGGKIGALEMAHADWLHIFNVNFFACVQLVQGLREPLEQARGTVVNMTSIVGSRVHPFASAAYAASKAALWALTRELAADLGRAGVRVNAVSPGEIDTGILSPGTDSIRGTGYSAAPARQVEGSCGLVVIPLSELGQLHLRL